MAENQGEGIWCYVEDEFVSRSSLIRFEDAWFHVLPEPDDPLRALGEAHVVTGTKVLLDATR
ncbi:hypothetical protein ACQUZK_09870, partial [Streptococcus pyogenes]|uniref:hypothetical protein n=1 Tax=Streptococcus pyogenes TaxID=1314 RepID=UPI003DA043BC